MSNDLNIEQDTENIRKLYKNVFKGRGGRTRIKIISEILKHPFNKHKLHLNLHISYNNVKYHITKLLEHNMIVCENRYRCENIYGTVFLVSEDFSESIFNQIKNEI